VQIFKRDFLAGGGIFSFLFIHKSSNSMKLQGFNPLSLMLFLGRYDMDVINLADSFWTRPGQQRYMVEIFWHRRETRR
jgi:hypothetical protein